MTLETLSPDEIPDRPQVDRWSPSDFTTHCAAEGIELHASRRFGGPPVYGSKRHPANNTISPSPGQTVRHCFGSATVWNVSKQLKWQLSSATIYQTLRYVCNVTRKFAQANIKANHSSAPATAK